VFRDTFRSRAISLVVLPLMKCSRRIRAIVFTISIPPTTCFVPKQAAQQTNLEEVILDADPPALGGQYCRPNDSLAGTPAIMNLEPTSDQVKPLLDSADRTTQATGGRVDHAR